MSAGASVKAGLAGGARILRGEHGRLARWTASMLGMLLACAVAGCGLFHPARPEPPSRGAIIPNYSTPDSTLETMANGIQDKARSNGQSAYTGALADSTADKRAFHAFFDQVTAQNYVSSSQRPLPTDWDYSHERNFYARFVTLPIGASSEYQMRWEEDQSQGNDVLTDTAVILHRIYTVYAILEDGDPLIIAHGFADLYLVKSSANRWALVRWDDREDLSSQFNPEALSIGQRRLESQ